MDNARAPKPIPLHLLKEITNNFSMDRKLGGGSYGDVYLGVPKTGEKIAVKVLKDGQDLDDKQYEKEYCNLASLDHKNIVRLVGYCHETMKEFIQHEGRTILVEKPKKMLCFEYMHNKGLDKFISDESNGHNWHTRYAIIKGICEGLEYIHEKLESPMYHLDLKPANILLDEKMTPKIADFGLSRLFLGEITKFTKSDIGTPGYRPPEYINAGVISIKFDIFSLGVVIIEIMAGRDGYFKSAEMPPHQFVELVHTEWMNRLQVTSMSTYSIQVKRCIKIALSCVQKNPDNRPSIGVIVNNVNRNTILDELRNGSESLIDENHQEHAGDLNQAVNAYFTDGPGTANTINKSIAPINIDDMDLDGPLDNAFQRSLYPEALHNPFALLDPNFQQAFFDRVGSAGTTNHDAQGSHPREATVEVKDSNIQTGPSGQASVVENVPGHRSLYGPGFRETVITDDDDDELSYGPSSQHANIPSSISQPNPPLPTNPLLFHVTVNDIEEEMMRAAIEASRREAEELANKHAGDLNQAVNAYFTDGPGTANTINKSIAPINIDDMDLDGPLDNAFQRSLYPEALHNPFALLDPNFQQAFFDRVGSAGTTNHDAQGSHPREATVEVKDSNIQTGPSGQASVVENVPGHRSLYGPGFRETVITDDDDDELSYGPSSQHANIPSSISQPNPPLPTNPLLFHVTVNDIEEEMMRAAIEASRREAEELANVCYK